jgi:hypothetical protein
MERRLLFAPRRRGPASMGGRSDDEEGEVSYRLGFSGERAGRLPRRACREECLWQLARRLPLPPHSTVRVALTDGRTFSRAFDRLDGVDLSAGLQVVVAADPWPDADFDFESASWRDVSTDPAITYNALLSEVATPEECVFGARGQMPVWHRAMQAIDGRYLFVPLPYEVDVVFGVQDVHLERDGDLVPPLSCWLHATQHIPLQPVELGAPLCVPIVASQYTPMTLRLEFEAVSPPAVVKFTCIAGLLGTAARRRAARSAFISRGGDWALRDGEVATSAHGDAFLDCSVESVGPWTLPCAAAFDYRLNGGDGGEGQPRFERGGLAGDEGWVHAGEMYVVSRVLPGSAPHFRVEARRHQPAVR